MVGKAPGLHHYDRRQAHLKWEHLRFMLGVVAQVGGSHAAYEARWPSKVAYTVKEDGSLQADSGVWNSTIKEHGSRRL